MGIATLVPFLPFRFWALQDPVASELSDAPCGLRMVVKGGAWSVSFGSPRSPEDGGDRTLLLPTRHRLPRATAMFCETTRYIAVFERPSSVTQWRRTGWLGS